MCDESEYTCGCPQCVSEELCQGPMNNMNVRHIVVSRLIQIVKSGDAFAALSAIEVLRELSE